MTGDAADPSFSVIPGLVPGTNTSTILQDPAGIGPWDKPGDDGMGTPSRRPPIDRFVRGIPKAELHVHLEGCIEPELMFALAERNGLTLRWPTPDALQAAYDFPDLASFLALYFEGCRVLVRDRDFYDLTRAYLTRAHTDGVKRAEMFLGPQSFTDRGVSTGDILNPILAAIRDAERDDGISAALLVSAHRHRSEDDALHLLDSIMPWAADIAGIGMGGAELGNPPSKFADFFRTCNARGFRTTIHAGEEGPASYVREALDLLQVDRIDHGNACLDDPALVRELAARRTPLTVCPLSNARLHVVPSLAHHPLRRMLQAGLNVSVHSDDPPYFGGTVADNFLACHDAFGLTMDEIATLARNSFASAFITPSVAAQGIAAVDAFVAAFAPSPDLKEDR